MQNLQTTQMTRIEAFDERQRSMEFYHDMLRICEIKKAMTILAFDVYGDRIHKMDFFFDDQENLCLGLIDDRNNDIGHIAAAEYEI